MGEEGGCRRVREIELRSWVFRINIDPLLHPAGPVCFPTLSKIRRKELQVIILNSCLQNRCGLKCGHPVRLWTGGKGTI